MQAQLPQRGCQWREHAQRVLLQALSPSEMKDLEPAAGW